MGRPPNEPDPSDGPLALFAAEHRRYRKNAGLTQVELATELVYTPQFVGMIEVAARTPSKQYVEGADRVLNADSGLLNCWKLVARMHIPKWFGPFIDVEAQCTAKREWECMVIPGLLQTAEYTRALCQAVRPEATEEQIEREVEVRMRRQELLLHRPRPLRLWAILDENVLRRPPAGPDIMQEQLAHLLEMTKLPHVIVQVLPYDAGFHPGQGGAFAIMERGDADEIVWVENHDDGRFIDRDDQVAEYARRYDHLRAMALSPAASRKMITALLE